MLLVCLDPELFSSHFLICAGNDHELFGADTTQNIDLSALAPFSMRVCLLALHPGLSDSRAGGLVISLVERLARSLRLCPRR